MTGDIALTVIAGTSGNMRRIVEMYPVVTAVVNSSRCRHPLLWIACQFDFFTCFDRFHRKPALSEKSILRKKTSLKQPAKKTLFTVMLMNLVLLTCISFSTHAQQISLSSSETAETSPDLTLLDNPVAVRELVSRLSDAEVRDLLLQQLDVVANTQGEEEAVDETSLFSLVTTNVPISVKTAFSQFPTMISDQTRIFTLFKDCLLYTSPSPRDS